MHGVQEVDAALQVLRRRMGVLRVTALAEQGIAMAVRLGCPVPLDCGRHTRPWRTVRYMRGQVDDRPQFLQRVDAGETRGRRSARHRRFEVIKSAWPEG